MPAYQVLLDLFSPFNQAFVHLIQPLFTRRHVHGIIGIDNTESAAIGIGFDTYTCTVLDAVAVIQTYPIRQNFQLNIQIEMVYGTGAGVDSFKMKAVFGQGMPFDEFEVGIDS